MAGLRPLFADIDPQTLNMDLASAETVVGPDTRVLLACPLFGHPLDSEAVLNFARRHNLIVIEDAAQAVGVNHSDCPAGSLGVCSVYSFGRGKIADAGGGAALLTDNRELAWRVRSELKAISGAGEQGIDREKLGASLQSLPCELERRACAAVDYRQNLRLPGVIHPDAAEDAPLWKYSLLFPDRTHRDSATRALLAAGIEATNLYRPLAPFFPRARNSSARFLVAGNIHTRIVNLPLWPLPEGTAVRAREALGADL
jgi:perosamine synthetase